MEKKREKECMYVYKSFCCIVESNKTFENLLKKVDVLMIGGGMAYTFFKSQGYEIGKSILDEPNIDLAAELLQKADEMGVKLMLPVDTVCAKEFNNDAESATYFVDEIPEDMMGLDIGPETVKAYKAVLDTAKTVVWNGPMGVFEMPKFAGSSSKSVNIFCFKT